MQIEYHKDDIDFIADVMHWAPIDNIVEKLRKGFISAECDEYMWCELTKQELEEFVGYLCLEANHNNKKRVAERMGEIADSFEAQLTCYRG